MWDYDTEEAKSNTKFDMTLNLAAGLVGLLVLLLVLVSPIVTKKTENPKGNIVVEIAWPECYSDVDLWVKAPNDLPVGYYRKNGKVFDLVRDDLGGGGEVSKANYEVAFAKGAPPGKYEVFIILFSNHPGSPNRCEMPFPVQADVDYYKTLSNKAPEYSMTRTVTLESVKERQAIVTFEIDENGDYVVGSESYVPTDTPLP